MRLTMKKKSIPRPGASKRFRLANRKTTAEAESSTRSPLTRRRWQTIGAQEAEPDLWAGREGCVSSRTQASCTCTYLHRISAHPSNAEGSPHLSLRIPGQVARLRGHRHDDDDDAGAQGEAKCGRFSSTFQPAASAPSRRLFGEPELAERKRRDGTNRGAFSRSSHRISAHPSNAEGSPHLSLRIPGQVARLRGHRHDDDDDAGAQGEAKCGRFSSTFQPAASAPSRRLFGEPELAERKRRDGTNRGAFSRSSHRISAHPSNAEGSPHLSLRIPGQVARLRGHRHDDDDDAGAQGEAKCGRFSSTFQPAASAPSRRLFGEPELAERKRRDGDYGDYFELIRLIKIVSPVINSSGASYLHNAFKPPVALALYDSCTAFGATNARLLDIPDAFSAPGTPNTLDALKYT
ncbi:hypothetical protein WH47_03015 [Habropoda laboriosa]|uniref:Uncharacterized protein n=1 Tax=Habropoda laboriosa TaxID=597456 RepID=A0A0L7QSX9_9HYME|nr:hypothetical protein WH47_03015 [Habropoda laboriosa]